MARGDAGVASDIELLVDLDPAAGNLLLRVTGISEELSKPLGVKGDLVTESLPRERLAVHVQAEAVPL